jgi:hypothetical protein
MNRYGTKEDIQMPNTISRQIANLKRDAGAILGRYLLKNMIQYIC